MPPVNNTAGWIDATLPTLRRVVGAENVRLCRAHAACSAGNKYPLTIESLSTVLKVGRFGSRRPVSIRASRRGCTHRAIPFCLGRDSIGPPIAGWSRTMERTNSLPRGRLAVRTSICVRICARHAAGRLRRGQGEQAQSEPRAPCALAAPMAHVLTGPMHWDYRERRSTTVPRRGQAMPPSASTT